MLALASMVCRARRLRRRSGAGRQRGNDAIDPAPNAASKIAGTV
jgi:hypothetical protein